MKDDIMKKQINDLMNEMIEICARMCESHIAKVRMLKNGSLDNGDLIDCEAAVLVMKEVAKDIRSMKSPVTS
jgi:hypothetical protein